MRRYVRVVADGGETRIPARGRTVFILSATAAIQVTVRSIELGKKEGLGQVGPIAMSARQKFRTADVFDDVTFANESGADNTITVLIGFADFDAPLAEVSIAVATTLTSTADATAAAAAAVILAADTTRLRAHIQALVSNTQNIRVGDSSITATRGSQLAPGVGLTIEGTAAINAIREAAGTVQIAILTERIP